MQIKGFIRIGVGIVMGIAILLLGKELINLFFTSKTSKESLQHQSVLEQIESLGKLELVKYRYKDIVEYKIERPWYRGGDSKALLIVAGEAVGCIDLTRIRKEDLFDKENVLIVQLPAPEICYVKINQQESKVYEVKTGFLTFDEVQVVETAYKEAEKQLEKTAHESNLLEQTRKNAEIILKPVLERIAKKKVVFRYDWQGIKIETETRPIPAK